MPSSVCAKLNAIRFDVLLGSGCVIGKKNDEGAGNLVNRVKAALIGGAPIGNEYTWTGLAGSGFSPSLAVVAIVPSGFMFKRVSRSNVAGVPFASVSVKPGKCAASPPPAAVSASLRGPMRRKMPVVVSYR